MASRRRVDGYGAVAELRALTEADCLKLISALIAPDKLPPITRVIPDVDIGALPVEVRADFGVVVWRGVWFPRGSSAWSPPPDA